MGAELHLARRYLMGLRRRTHVATVTLISVVGLGLGVLALIVSLALLEGFQSSIRRDLVAKAAHARVEAAQGRRLENADEVVSLLHRRLPEVELVEVVRGTGIVGSTVDAVPASIIGRSDVTSATVNRVLTAQTGTGPGERLQVLSARQRLTPMGPVPVRALVEVEGIEQASPGTELAEIVLPLAVAQRLLWGEPVVDAVELRDPADPWSLGARVRSALRGAGGDLRVEGLDDLHRPLLLALALERVMIFLAVGLMLVVASLNLLCNVAMVAAEKRTDLAVLAGVGMPPAALRRLFVMLGVGIGMVGSLAGAVLGVMLAVGLDVTGALPLPRGVFVVSSVPFDVQPLTVALVVVLSLGLAVAASWLPARVVARREPAEGLRYE